MKQETNSTNVPGRRPFLRRVELWVMLAVLLLALLWLALAWPKNSGAVARVSVHYGQVEETFDIPLGEDGTYHIEAALPVILQVEGGGIRFVHSQCPDHVCEGFGTLRREGEWALCAPAGVMVSVMEEENGGTAGRGGKDAGKL